MNEDKGGKMNDKAIKLQISSISIYRYNKKCKHIFEKIKCKANYIVTTSHISASMVCIFLYKDYYYFLYKDLRNEV